MIEFTVYAKPEPQGSTRAFIPKGWKRPIITTDNPKIKGYRQQVAQEAFVAMGTRQPLGREIPVRLTCVFYLKRPESLPKRKQRPTSRPDCGKLCRSTEDAMTGIVYTDDSQIVILIAEKRYGQPERAEIKVEALAVEAQSGNQTGGLFKD